MPVRIFFRGLVLFRFPDMTDPVPEYRGRIVAQLINAPRPAGAMAMSHPAGGPHVHGAEIQIVTGSGISQEFEPVPLPSRARVFIEVAGNMPVDQAPSFQSLVPRLSDVAVRPEDGIERWVTAGRNVDYIQNTVTIDHGTIRVKDLVTWDGGGYPLTGDYGNLPARLPENYGRLPATPQQLKFMACDVRGHMANEVVVDVFDGNAASIRTDRTVPGLRPAIRAMNHDVDDTSVAAVRGPNHRTPTDTLDIRITNYPMQREAPVPWGLDFQWLFAAAGYRRQDLSRSRSGDELSAFTAFAERYFEGRLFEEDRAELLPGTEGLPFPYIVPGQLPLSALRPPTDIESRPVCVPAAE